MVVYLISLYVLLWILFCSKLNDNASQSRYSSNGHVKKYVGSIIYSITCGWTFILQPPFCHYMHWLNDSVQFISVTHVQCFETPWTAACQASLSITNYHSLLKLMSIESFMPSNQLILCCPLLLLPSILPSIRVFFKESVLHSRWPKYWSFSFSISSFNEYSGLISFRMDWFDLLAVQRSLKSLLQHTTVQQHPFFGTQLSL